MPHRKRPKVGAVSKLSDRLSDAKRELGLSAAGIVRAAEKGGYTLSDYNAKVYISGKHGDPKAETLEALSYALRVPLGELRALAGLPDDLGEFEADASARMLTRPQRDAVNEIIRLLADGNQGADHANVTPLSAQPRTGTTTETTPQKMKPLPARYAADQGDSAGEEGWAEAQQLGEESQDDNPEQR